MAEGLKVHAYVFLENHLPSGCTRPVIGEGDMHSHAERGNEGNEGIAWERGEALQKEQKFKL